VQGDLSHTRPSWAVNSLREGDLIVGKNQGSVIGTLVERQTRLIRLLLAALRALDHVTSMRTVRRFLAPRDLVRLQPGLRWL